MQNPNLKWMIWLYPYFRNPPNIYIVRIFRTFPVHILGGKVSFEKVFGSIAMTWYNSNAASQQLRQLAEAFRTGWGLQPGWVSVRQPHFVDQNRSVHVV